MLLYLIKELGMEIKKADRSHIDEIMSLYKDAKIFMDIMAIKISGL